MIAKPVLNQARPTAERPCAHRGWKKKPSLGRFLFPGLFAFSLLIFCGAFQISAQQLISDVNPLALPEIGSYGLRVLSPNVLELTLITTKQPDPARVSAWDFVDGNFNATLPPVSEFAVTVNNQMVSVTAVGFKRRVLSAPEKPGDLRIASEIYLTLGASIADGQSVEVKNPSSTLWKDPVKYVATKDALRLSPVLHVSQLGYMPSYPKKAMVGYYLGSLGELPIPTEVGFQLIDSQTGATVYHGKLTLRADVGFSYAPLPYQEVYQADFTAFSTPGEYRLVVPGLGESFPFRIDDGVTAGFARTFALGLFNQRCGSGNYLPFTRHTHDPCHIAPAQIPTMDAEFSEVQDVLQLVTGDYLDETLQTAPSLENVAASLYPFVNHGTVDVSGGHHDAGDYSKYTINSAGLTHFLVFAADSFPGVGSLDNLGTPESGDGKSDILEEAKWEADFLAKMQDADGGFYFLVYPKDRRYENNVLPDHGDPQVVFPKTTSVTAAAVAALAEAGSSPLMKAQFPTEAANYLRKAQLGWTFLMNAIAKYGKLGAYQKITHYGNEWGHDDELAWAAAALYAATGDAQYQSKLFEFFPDPNDVSSRRWTWWRLFEGYGCAVRTYAFAARSGRLPASKLDQSYLGKCEAEIIATGDDHVRFSQESAYATSFPDTTKEYRSPGWYFSSERAFDVTVAYQVTPRPEYLETVMANCNYEAGVNPLNMTYITGIGFKREREIVSQYAWNDQRILPLGGLPIGNIRPGYGYLETYFSPGTTSSELPYLSYPSDMAANGPYAYYDRWTDMIDTMTEAVVMDQARCLASLSFWMAQGATKNQPWTPILGQITGLDAGMQAGAPTGISLKAPGIDLSTAQVLWEVRYLEPVLGNPLALTPKYSGDHWIEAEALLPDGRRVLAVSNFVAIAAADAPPNSFQSAPLGVQSDMAALYHLDGNLTDAAGKSPALALSGNTRLDASNVSWMAPGTVRSGTALRFLDLGDQASVQIPTSALQSGSGIVLEGMVYVNEFKAYARDVATIFALIESYNDSYLEFREDKYLGPMILGGNVFSFTGASLTSAITTKQWHHVRLEITPSGYAFKLDGAVLASRASNELTNWGRAPKATLLMGNFDGWIDEVTIRGLGNIGPSIIMDDLVAGTYPYPASIFIRANPSSAPSAAIQKVEFYAGTTKIGEDLTAPYTILWIPSAPGNFAISAKVTDALGQTATAAPANVTVGTPVQPASLFPVGPSARGFRVRLTGPKGVLYQIQSSADGVTWTEIGSAAASTFGTEFVDTTGATDHRFYRALRQ